MKSTGIVRPVDSLGRVVLPIELRRVMNIECKDSIEIFVEGPYNNAQEVSAELHILRL